MTKNKPKIFYDKKGDSLWLLVQSGAEYEHKEIAPGISVELGKKGELLGVEILNASQTLATKFGQKAPRSRQQSTAVSP